MTQYTNRADLLIAAGESIKMQEKAGIDPVLKYIPTDRSLHIIGCDLLSGIDSYEFPLAVVEGKPVFVGDELYDHDAAFINCPKFTADESHRGIVSKSVSWLPPKPKTVMVELLREDAEWWLQEDFCSDRQVRVQSACRKALEVK